MYFKIYVRKTFNICKTFIKKFCLFDFEHLYFPEENLIVAAIYKKYKIDEIRCYQILTDTDSTSIQFIIISDPSSTYRECDVRDILFEIFSKTDIRKRFDRSNEFWKKFDVHAPQDEKVLGLYEVENINDPCYVALAVSNPKEYSEYFESENCNKKHKGIKKVAKGMEYENYAERIKPIINFKTYKKPKADIKSVARISVKKGEITTYLIKKNKFSQLNDKRLYFPNAITSFPFGHITLKEIDEYKKDKGRKIEKYFWKEKETLLELEKEALKRNERLNVLDNILKQVPKIASLSTLKFDRNTKFLHKEKINKCVLDYILEARWRNTRTIVHRKHSCGR